jgi:hypothetical protein
MLSLLLEVFLPFSSEFFLQLGWDSESLTTKRKWQVTSQITKSVVTKINNSQRKVKGLLKTICFTSISLS